MKRGLILTGGSASADVELAVRAEAAGFDAVFSIEFFNRHGFVPLGAIAHATSEERKLELQEERKDLGFNACEVVL